MERNKTVWIMKAWKYRDNMIIFVYKSKEIAESVSAHFKRNGYDYAEVAEYDVTE